MWGLDYEEGAVAIDGNAGVSRFCELLSAKISAKLALGIMIFTSVHRNH